MPPVQKTEGHPVEKAPRDVNTDVHQLHGQAALFGRPDEHRPDGIVAAAADNQYPLA